MNDPLLLTVKAAADRLSVCTRTIERMVDAGELPKVKVRGASRIPVQALCSWVDRHTQLQDNGACAGPDVQTGDSTCHTSVMTVTSGGLVSPHQTARELGDLLERKSVRKQSR